MPILAVEVEPLALEASCDDHIKYLDGREITALGWLPRLQKATFAERQDWRLIGGGIGLHWEMIDEDISVESLLRLK